tara:strand:+ start:344 stop:1207 length:864 start_codon:yes stop_codon:yes gene_type:complete
MLGLTNGLHYPNPPSGFSPEQISTLVAWWDFSDTENMFTDAGSTKVSANDDKIYRINNKAYSLIATPNNALGTFLQQTTEANRPLYKTAGGGCALFDGSNDMLNAKPSVGNVDVNKLSDTTLNGRELTIFYVVELPGTTVSGDEYLFHTCGADPNDRFSIYVDNDGSSDAWQTHHQNNSARTNTIINSGISLTTSKELWTVDLDGASSGSVYRNGDTSDGVTNGATDDHDINLSVNDNDVKINIGANAAGSDYLNGIVYEMIVYDAALSDANISLVEAFLMSKHSIS